MLQIQCCFKYPRRRETWPFPALLSMLKYWLHCMGLGWACRVVFSSLSAGGFYVLCFYVLNAFPWIVLTKSSPVSPSWKWGTQVRGGGICSAQVENKWQRLTPVPGFLFHVKPFALKPLLPAWAVVLTVAIVLPRKEFLPGFNLCMQSG